MNRLRRAAGSLADRWWDLRRSLHAEGILRGSRVPARVVSIGNLTVGGAGKTTLVLHLARRARTSGIAVAVACRRYRPGPGGFGDEERMFEAQLGREHVFAGARKRDQAAAAARAGAELVLVDDGFSHWGLERDLDIVVLDSQDPWGGGVMLPAGRLREPRRALQRAEVVVISRLGPTEDPAPWMDEARRYAPAAALAAGRHACAAFRGLDGAALDRPGRVLIVTGTGNPRAVARTASEVGLEVVGLARYRDHHWFSAAEARIQAAAARRERADLLITAKDAVRWPSVSLDARVAVMEVEWRWVCGGELVERLAFAGRSDG